MRQRDSCRGHDLWMQVVEQFDQDRREKRGRDSKRARGGAQVGIVRRQPLRDPVAREFHRKRCGGLQRSGEGRTLDSALEDEALDGGCGCLSAQPLQSAECGGLLGQGTLSPVAGEPGAELLQPWYG